LDWFTPEFIVSLAKVIVPSVIVIIGIWYKRKRDLRAEVITVMFPRILSELRSMVEQTRKSYVDYYIRFDVFPYLTSIINSGQIELVKKIDKKLYMQLKKQHKVLTFLINGHLKNKYDFKRKLIECWQPYLDRYMNINFTANQLHGFTRDIEYVTWSEDKSETYDCINEGHTNLMDQRERNMKDGARLSSKDIEILTVLALQITGKMKNNRKDIEAIFVYDIELDIILKIEKYMENPI